MTTVLLYGLASTLELDLEPEALVAQCDAPRGTALSDPASAAAAALSEPLDFPALARSVVPGDRVTIALEPGVPQAASVVAAIMETLTQAGVDPGDVTILRTQADVQNVPNGSHVPMSGNGASAPKLLVHTPDDRQQMGYLGITREGRPIYLNRALGDADVVLPVGCLRLQSPGQYGVYSGLFPTFSDTKTLERFQGFEASPLRIAQRKTIRQEVNEVGGALGVRFSIQVVPGPGDQVLRIVAGDTRKVFQQARQLCEEAWRYEIPRRASLVVATIPGDASQQTWANVGRALASASRAVTEDGAIAICCDLDSEPGPAVQRLANAEDLRRVVRRIRKEKPQDMLPATQLAKALSRSRVYLLSRLDQSVVEELGVAAVSEAEEIARLASRHESCILLENAQYAVPTALDD